ncbi:MAG TPA: DUF748 domain-containing protein [Steroidobacteraceae bacterium]|nr:DUF748 domain-containing protein [Steroidobacteraceae bacterium]
MGRYRRYLIALGVVVLLIGACAAAAFLAVPYFARKALTDFVRTHYARTLTLGEIHFNPFTLALDVTGVALPDADGQVMLSFQRLHVRAQLASLWRLAPSFGEILLEQPYVRVVIRPGGAVNLADLGKGFPPAPQPQQPSAPLKLFIQRFAVISGSSSFEDHTHPSPFRAEFKPIAFELRDFSTTGHTGNGYSLHAASPEGERLIWSGNLRLDPLSSHGVFEVSDLQARTLWKYLRESVPFEIASGVIGVKGDYDLSAGAGPLSLDVNVHDTTVTDLGLRPKATAANYVELARLEVHDTRVNLARHSVDVAKVILSGGDIKAWMSEERRLNLLELAPGNAGPAAAAPPAAAPAQPATPEPPGTRGGGPSASAWKVSAPDIRLQGFKVSAEDRGVKPALAVALEPLNIHVTGFNTSPDDTLDVTLDCGVNSSGKLTAHAKVTPQTGSVSAHAEATGVELPLLQPYLARYTSMTLLQGTLGARLDVERGADGSLSVKGNTGISGLHTVDNALKQDFVNWKELRVADVSYRSSPQSLRVGSVTALEPYIRLVIAPDRTTNIGAVLKPPGAKQVAPPEAASAPPAESAAATPAPAAAVAKTQTAPVAPAAPPTPFPTSIGTVTLINGTANYADLWIKPSFAIGIQSLHGTVSGLSSDPKSRARVKLNGKVDRYSPLQIEGVANLLSGALYTDIKLSFKDLDLTVVNPYSGHFAGYKIDKGKLSVEVSYKIEQRKLDAAQHFVVDQLELGDRVESPDAVHLPLKIAVALLKDRNGVIDLNLPMTGSLDDPQFRIGPIIWKMFVNLIVKAATAPFALLGHLFGGGEHMNIVEFAPGSAELDPPAKEQLASLAKGMAERPQLKLDVPIAYSVAVDRPRMAARRLHQELLARVLNTREGRKHPDSAGELALADPQKHFKLLLEQYREDLGKDAALPPTALAVQQAKRGETPAYDPAIADLKAALIDHVQIADADLEALGKQRALAIQGALVAGQVDPGRVFIVVAPPQPQAGDKVKVEMAVK